MGANLCTGPMEVKESQAVMLAVDVGELTVNSSTFKLHKSVSLLRHPHWKEYKHTASVQSLLVTPKTGERKNK